MHVCANHSFALFYILATSSLLSGSVGILRHLSFGISLFSPFVV
eukprot:COSAG02_NODE_68928_length_212_cov_2.238938_1_plen_43_part_10